MEDYKSYSSAEIIDLLMRLSSDSTYLELKKIYEKKSLPEVLGVGRREMSHSAFLAWLFDSKETHGLGSFALYQLLLILAKRDSLQKIDRHNNNKTRAADLMQFLINNDIVFGETVIKTENFSQGNNEGREDICIECPICFNKKRMKLHIIVENKIFSKETRGQTVTYYKNITGKYPNDYCFFAFLTPKCKEETDRLDKPECDCQEFIQICYQDLMNYILEPCQKKDISNYTRSMINEYIHCLEYNHDRKHIMATSTHVKELLRSFWNQNEVILSLLMKSVSNDTEQDIEVRALAHKIVSGKEFVFIFNGQIIDTNVDLARAIRDLIYKKEDDSILRKLSDEVVEAKVNGSFAKIHETLVNDMVTHQENDFKPTLTNKGLYSTSNCRKGWEEFDNGKFFYVDWNRPNLDLLTYVFHNIREKMGYKDNKYEIKVIR